MNAGQLEEWAEAIAEETLKNVVDLLPPTYRKSLLKAIAQLAAVKALNDLKQRGLLKTGPRGERLNKLIHEYRATMNEDVLHSWAQDLIHELQRLRTGPAGPEDYLAPHQN